MGFIQGGLFGKKDCWKCVGNTRVKKRISKLLPCGSGWQLSQPNCGVSVGVSIGGSTGGGFIGGGLFGKKDCWKCVGNTRVKKRISKLLPCGSGWQLSQPNCGVRVVTPNTGVTVINRPNTPVTVSPNTPVTVRPNTPVTVRPNIPVTVRPNIPGNAPGWWSNSPTRPIINPIPVSPPQPGYPYPTIPTPTVPVVIPPMPIPVVTPEPTIVNNYYTTEPETATAGMGDGKMVLWLALGGAALWYLTKK